MFATKYRQPDAHAHHHQSISTLAIRIFSALIAIAALAIVRARGLDNRQSCSGNKRKKKLIARAALAISAKKIIARAALAIV